MVSLVFKLIYYLFANEEFVILPSLLSEIN